MQKKIVLIVDDDQINLKILEDFLTREGYRIIVSSSLSGAELLICSEDEINLALLDIYLPEGRGYTLIPLLKEKHPDSAIVIMSSDSPDNIPELEAYAIDYFLEKPFSLKALLQVI